MSNDYDLIVKELKKLHILYVQPNDLLKQRHKKILLKYVGTLTEAESAAEALKIFKKLKPDIVITEIKMPGIDGLKMTQSIKKITDDTVIIMMANYDGRVLISDAIDAGVDNYIFNPPAEESIISALLKATSKLMLKRELRKQDRLVKNILNNQKNMVIVTDGTYISQANETFLNVLGFKSLDEFHEKEETICNFLEDKHHSISCEKNINWFEQIVKDKAKDRVVKIRDRQTEEIRAFTINFRKYSDLNPNDYIVSFTDITDITLEVEHYKHQSIIDNLTKIYNRAHLKTMLNMEFKRFTRYKITSSIIMFEIDNSEKISKKAGHLVLDKVIADVASMISKHLRVTDVFARWGGSEFMILATHTELSGSVKLANQLKEKIMKEKINGIKITASFGITSFKEDDKNLFSVVKRVDRLLQDAKDKAINTINYE